MTLMQRVRREVSTLRDILYYRLRFDSASENRVTRRFSEIYFHSHVLGKSWESTSWMGVPVYKCPTDLWTYQELIYEVTPDVIVETGTSLGGSAFYLASLCDLVDKGKVVSVEIENEGQSVARARKKPSRVRPIHPRITYLRGSSTSPMIVQRVKDLSRSGKRVLVILDSDHGKAHVLEELRAYAPLVSLGSYVIVEDSNVNGHPVLPEFGPGPMEAIEEFLSENQNFKIDRSRENHLLTFNPRGYLRRVG
jgi:cephalosporin hydroxylase